MYILMAMFISFICSQLMSTEPGDGFQEDLYRQYFSIKEKNAWVDFCSQSSGIMEQSPEVIISLTSYPARIKTTWLSVESLLRQDTKPAKVVLNLFEGEFPDRKLPETIEKQITRGLEINWCQENLKVYLKIIPTIQKYPEALVVATDDDIIYPPNLVADLLEGHKKYPNCIIAKSTRRIIVKDNLILPVPYWSFSVFDNIVYVTRKNAMSA